MKRHSPLFFAVGLFLLFLPTCATDVSNSGTGGGGGSQTCFDTTYGNTVNGQKCGIATTPFSGIASFAQFDQNGNLLVAGPESVGSTTPAGCAPDATTGICTSASGLCNPSVLGTCFSVFRFTPAGALDTSFGNGGKLQTFLNNGVALQVDGNGRIIVGGSVVAAGKTTWAVGRYNANGSGLDSTFSVPNDPPNVSGIVNLTGIFVPKSGYNFSLADLVLQTSDINITNQTISPTNPLLVVAGSFATTVGSPGTSQIGMVRLLPNGNIDTSVTPTSPPPTDINTAYPNVVIGTFNSQQASKVTRVLIDNSGNILIAGESCIDAYGVNGTNLLTSGINPVCPVVMTRFTLNGANDSSFAASSATPGELVTPGTSLGCIFIVGGNILLSEKFGAEGALLRYTSSGTLDTSFGANGIASSTSTLFAVERSTNNILLASSSGPNQPALIQYTSGGTFNSSFGTQNLNGLSPKLINIEPTSGKAIVIYDNGLILSPAPGISAGVATLTLIRLTPNQP